MSKSFLKFLSCWLSAAFFGYLTVEALSFQIWNWAIIWAAVGLLLILRLTFSEMKLFRVSYWMALFTLNLHSLISGHLLYDWFLAFILICAIVGSAVMAILETVE